MDSQQQLPFQFLLHAAENQPSPTIHLSSNDVLLGRGTAANNHIGNVWFRDLVDQKRGEYLRASKEQKRQIALDMVQQVKQRGRFLQAVKNGGSFSYKIASDAKALDKCMHALRDKKRAMEQETTDLLKTEKILDWEETTPVAAIATGTNAGTVPVSTDSNKATLATADTNPAAPANAPSPSVAASAIRKREVPSANDSSDRLDMTKLLLGVVAEEKEQDDDLVRTVLHSFRSDSTCLTMTIADIRAELRTLTSLEQQQALEDIFGRQCNIQPNKKLDKKKEKDGTYIYFALEMMKKELEWIEDSQKSAFVEAKGKCKNLEEEFGNARLLSFLRYADWHPKQAAERMAKYWEKRKHIFGPQKFHLPITLNSGALDDMDLKALQSGTFVPLPRRDVHGRQLFWAPLAKNNFQGYTVPSLVSVCACLPSPTNRGLTVAEIHGPKLRGLWYVMEVACQEDQENKGIVRIGHYKNASMLNLDPDMYIEYYTMTRDCWPVKVMADHTINCSEDIARLMLPITRPAKGKETRIRSTVHSVPEDQVVAEFANYGITEEMIPIEGGGSLDYSIDDWISHRQKVEAGDCQQGQSSQSTGG